MYHLDGSCKSLLTFYATIFHQQNYQTQNPNGRAGHTSLNPETTSPSFRFQPSGRVTLSSDWESTICIPTGRNSTGPMTPQCGPSTFTRVCHRTAAGMLRSRDLRKCFALNSVAIRLLKMTDFVIMTRVGFWTSMQFEHRLKPHFTMQVRFK